MDKRIRRYMLLLLLSFVLIFAFALSGCSSSKVFMKGTITFVDLLHNGMSLNGETYKIYIDTNGNTTDGVVKEFTGTWGNGYTINFSVDITDVPSGQYYICAEVKPTGYFIYGYYGGTPISPYGPAVLADIRSGEFFNIYINIT